MKRIPERAGRPVPAAAPHRAAGAAAAGRPKSAGKSPCGRRIKAAALALLVAVAALLLPGCHGSRGLPGFSMPEAFDESEPIELTFWAKNDTNRRQTAIYEKAIEDFEELYPNISVSLRLYTDYGKIYNDVITNISTGTTPNVCISYPDHIATYMTGTNVVVPLDGLFDDERYGLGGSGLRFDSPRRDELVPQFLDECLIGGAHYAVPYMRSTEACYANKSYVEKLGYELPEVLTWDYVWEVSEAAMAKDAEGNFAVNGQKVMIPFIYKSTDNMMIQMLRQRGADYSGEDGHIGLFNDTTGEILRTIAGHAATGAFSTFRISSYPGNFLNAGQCIFAVDSTAGATWMGSEAPLMDIHSDQVVQFEIAVRPVPQYDPEHPRMISQGPSICIFNKKDSQVVLASWLFTQYLLSDGVQTAYAETEGYVPVTVRAQESTEYRDYLARKGEDTNEHYEVKIEASELLMANTENTFVTPVFNGSASLRNAAGELIENVTKSVRRRQTVDDAYIAKLYGDVRQLYRLDQLGGRDVGGARQESVGGPLPAASERLIALLASAWVFIACVCAVRLVKRRRRGGGRGSR